MITTTTLDSRDDFTHRGSYEIDDTDFEDMNATYQQKKSLAQLIMEKVTDENERESFLSSIEFMSRSDIEDLRWSLLTNIW